MSGKNVGGPLRQERVLLMLSLVAFALAAVASSLYYFRLDLTRDRSFTLSAAARNLHLEIPETVSISYYVSPYLATLHPGPKAVEDSLRELEARSHGRIRMSVRDPAGNSGSVEALGIHPQQMEIREGSEARIATVYSGILVEYLDDYRVLPSVLDADSLEYEVVKAIRSLVRGTVPVAALLEGDGDKSLGGDYRILRAALARAGYEVRDLARGKAVEPDVSVLFVLGNAALDDYDAYFVDRYLSGGGRVFVAARGVRVDPDRGLLAQSLPANALLNLLSEYGVQVREELVLDASCLTVPFEAAGPSGGSVYKYVRYPHWVVTDKRNAAAFHPITARYSGLDLYWPSPVELEKVDGLEGVSLVKSTDKAWKQTRDFAAGPAEEALYREEEDATRGQYVLAVAVSGTFPSAFSHRSPPLRPGASEPLPAPVPSEGRLPGRLVVVGSSDFLTDLMSMNMSEFNASFAVSAADWLSSDTDLPLPVTRSGSGRLKTFDDPEDRLFRVRLVYLVNLVVVPGLVVAFALFRALRRRKAERAARAAAGKGGLA